MRAPLRRRLLAEFLGTALLLAAIVGSGIMASRLSPADAGLQLLQNMLATILALGVLILVFGPVSGAHFNPVVTLTDWWLHRRDGAGPSGTDVATYVVAQLAGGVAGAILANVMFGLVPASLAKTGRTGVQLWIGEMVATAGLVLVIFALVRTHRTTIIPAAVAAYIGAAVWFTSSTAFANPAVTIGRAFSDTFTGISLGSVPGFLGAQLVGGALGVLAVVVLYPRPVTVTGDTAAIELETSR